MYVCMWVGVSTGIPEIKISSGLSDLAAREIKWLSNSKKDRAGSPAHECFCWSLMLRTERRVQSLNCWATREVPS